MITFDVIGLPAPQGSKRHVGNGVMIESSKALKPWRDSVAAAAREVADDVGMLDGPLHLAVDFRFPMPKSRPKAAHQAGVAAKITAPDIDKLLRGVADALKVGGLIKDDALIYSVRCRKWEVTGWTGAIVSLERVL
jgi:Holliday junction resolvase RusA-like endonuclease